MAALGIKYVRVPVSWCWTEHDPVDMVTLMEKEGVHANDEDEWYYMSDEEVQEKFTCVDPFYDNVRWPASECVSFVE